MVEIKTIQLKNNNEPEVTGKQLCDSVLSSLFTFSAEVVYFPAGHFEHADIFDVAVYWPAAQTVQALWPTMENFPGGQDLGQSIVSPSISP